MQQIIWHWKAWTNAKLFGIYCFSQFFTVLSQFWKWLKTYFRRNFYKLNRNEANNIPLKSYGKCATFSCRWFLWFLAIFKQFWKQRDHALCLLSQNRVFENAPRDELELHQHVYLNFTLFHHVLFFARSSPSTHRNWASDIPMESCCKHATFPSWSFFSYSRRFKRFSFEIHLA